MGAPYPGYDSFGPWHTYVPGKGRWVIGMAADDGDEDDAAHLMALVMGVSDCAQWLGHRAIDIVSGSPPGGYANGDLVFTGNFDFQGITTFSGATGQVGFYVPTYIVGGATLHVGDPFLGHGHVVVIGGSDITLDGSGGSLAQLTATGSNGWIKILNDGWLYVDTSSMIRCEGVIRIGLPGNVPQGGAKVEQYAHHRKLGNHAITELRVKTLPTDGSLVKASEADIWMVPAQLVAPASCGFDITETEVFEFSVVQDDTSNQFFDFTITNVGVFHAFSGSTANASGCDVKHLGSGKFKITGTHNAPVIFYPTI